MLCPDSNFFAVKKPLSDSELWFLSLHAFLYQVKGEIVPGMYDWDLKA